MCASFLLLLKSNLTTETIPSAIPYILITPLFVWWYLKQNRLKRFRNQFTKSTNFNKVRTCLRDLDWAFSTHQNIIYLNSNTFLLKWVFVRIVPLDNEILYSFQYIDGRGFRPLFFVGIRSYLKRKFEKKLNTTTHIAYGG